ncbi:uncharacterized protein LOC142179862 [Nicotiana tabacum]|uniref:Uncharacterized protein LOC142179862 n=1 Tax=Nicotiana tabacum TaxID=4097 RepID=A0AC58UBI3_TOBAC
MAETGNLQIDHNHPLFLQQTDTPGIALIDIKLTGLENYALWSRSMRMALLVKNKLGFIDGTCLKSSYRGELGHQWERCNVMVLLWIGRTISTELQPSIIYASDVRKDEMDLTVLGAGCDCEETKPFLDQFKNVCLLQFLVGLNESYSHVRSEILLKILVLIVNQAYALAVQEKSQRTLSVANSDKEPLTMLAGRGQGFKATRKPGFICDYCGYKGHLKENCYKIICYPPDFKSKKKTQNSGVKRYANVSVGE